MPIDDPILSWHCYTRMIHANNPRARFWLLTLWGIASYSVAATAYYMAAQALDHGFALQATPWARSAPLCWAFLLLLADVGPACLYAVMGWKIFGCGTRFLLAALHVEEAKRG